MTATVPADLPTVVAVEARPAAPARDRRFLLLLAAAVLVGCALRIGIGLTDDAPMSDETAYLGSGISLVEGDGFEREGRPELHFPPFVPFVLGAASLVFADEHAGAVVMTIIFGTALLVPLALLARRIAGPTAGLAAAWIAALAPGTATLPTIRGTGSETEYTFLVVAALWFGVSAADHRGRGRLLRLAGSGLLVGLAYLTRPEGLFLALPLGLAVLYMAHRDAEKPEPGASGASFRLGVGRWKYEIGKSSVRAALTAGTAFAIPLLVCIAPYVAFLHEHTGEWQLTAKTQDVSLEAWHAVARGDRQARDEILYALDETGLRFADERSSLPSLVREDPGGYLEILGTNVRMLFKTIGGVSLLPLPVWALTVYGAWRYRRSRTARLLLAASVLPVATALMFFVQSRYLAAVTALAIVLAGVGVAKLPDRFRRGALAGVLVMLAVLAVLAFRGNRAGWWHPTEHTDQRLAGEWIEENTDSDDLIMTRSMVVAYYAERPNLATPYADYAQILAFARHYGTQYLVADSASTARLRPQLRDLLELEQLDGLRLVHESRAEGRTTRVFALDPAPPPTDEVGPSLGFMGDGLG